VTPILASSSSVAARMSRQARRNTSPELAIRHLLFAGGYRYRVHYPVPGMPRRSIDVAFPGAQLAVFVDGCYWHGCKRHKTIPRANHEWWEAKLANNRARDRDTDRWLKRRGWTIVRAWEHEGPNVVVARVESNLRIAATRLASIRL
jgi:DNA mismatch endonuclease, patch repair protein